MTTQPTHLDCAERCDIPQGVSLREVPPTRHDWSDVVRCPNDGCGKTFLVTSTEGDQ